MKNQILLITILTLCISISGCKSIKKNKNSSVNEQDIQTEQIDERTNISQFIEEDKSESDFVEEVLEQTVTRQELIINPITNETSLSPIVTTTVTRRSSGNEKLKITKVEISDSGRVSSFTQDLKTESDSSILNKESEGQDAGEIVGTVGKLALEGIFKGLFGNVFKMLMWIVIIVLLFIVFFRRRKKEEGSN